MFLQDLAGAIAGTGVLIAFVPYIKAIIRGDAHPRKATWLVWSLGDFIILAGQLAKQDVSLLLVGATIGAGVCFLVVLKYGEPGLSTIEKICLCISLSAIALWIFFGESNWGIGFGCFSLWVAAWPTYLGAWKNPTHEDKKGWLIFNASNIFALLAIQHFLFVEMVPPITFAVIDAPMLWLAFRTKQTSSLAT